MNVNEELFMKYVNNELTEDEKKQLLAWLRESPKNQEMFFLWKDSFLYLNYEDEKRQASTHREWHKFLKRIGGNEAKLKWVYACTAAAVILLCMVGGWFAGSTYTEMSMEKGLITLETEVGQQVKTTLPDGTSVLLNSCSVLSYSPTQWKHERNVSLKGEAIFDVTKDTDRPFHVKTLNYDIHVLGTNFNVMAYDTDIEGTVTLKRGKVGISLPDRENELLCLQPGESFIFDNLTGEYRVEKRSLTNVYAWERKQIIFEGHSLMDKKDELTRHFGYTFHISPEMEDVTYKATVRDESITEFLNILVHITPDMTYQIDADKKTVYVGKESDK